MCQGKMPHNVLERYQKLLIEQPKDGNIPAMLSNYKNALLHPNMHDIEAAKMLVKSIFN